MFTPAHSLLGQTGDRDDKKDGRRRQSFSGTPQPETLQIQIPQIVLPKGGGAIKSIDEKFRVNASNGTASLSIPLPVSAARHGFVPNINLTYNSGLGNSSFGVGWNLNISSISRKTDKGLPQYLDEEETDTYLLSDAEELVPYLEWTGTQWKAVEDGVSEDGKNYQVKRYRPRIEASFARIERWKDIATGTIHWKTITKDNITSLYGKSPDARLAHPAEAGKIFEWLPEFSYDDRGNCIQYAYKSENGINTPDTPSENHRKHLHWPFANKYIERIKYGAKTPYLPETGAIPELMFETIFDYNELPPDVNAISANAIQHINDTWSCRKDPFSTYNPCFEIRTYRLCHRVFHFHHFQELGLQPYLVSSMDFQYHYDALAGLTFMESTTSKGYKKTNNKYSVKELPPFTFEYEKMGWDTQFKNISTENLENLPAGIDDQTYQWVDLYSEGISGILSEQGNGWFYKSNLGGGEFEKTKLLVPKPSFTGLKEELLQLHDLEADGRKFIVSYAKEYPGYFELTEDQKWENFKNFNRIPAIDFKNDNIKFIDLNGDGKADLLISEDEVFCWYESKGVAGYSDYRFVRKEWEEEKGPAVVFDNSSQSIMLADMSGDGLTDIVRIRNGEIAYWPNLGYGKFGAKVIMDNAPRMDSPEHFSSKNIRLADINGSGTTDLVYLTRDTFKVWFNLSGNGWGDVQEINPFPAYDFTAHVTVIDLLGHGTSCIVWSSPLPDNVGRQMRYIDLMGGKKPFLLTRFENNMGKRVTIRYKSSTHYYLEDKKAGSHWVTKLPFPVHCLDKVITEDLEYVDNVLKPRLRFTQSFSYHHGYYDYSEREFRGFGRIDQVDTEDFDHFKLSAVQNVVEADLHQSPVKTVTWYHTGAYFNREKILDQFATEYTKGPWEFDLPQPVLPNTLTPVERREAFRAFKGMALRQEVYSLDGSPEEKLPYSAAFHSCFIKMLQPGQGNKQAVFLVQESEGITYHYERNLNDPRIAHTFNLEIDTFGNVLKSASIVYGRKTPDALLPPDIQAEQKKIHIVFSETEVTKEIDLLKTYRLPVPSAARTYELTGIIPINNQFFTFKELLPAFLGAAEIGYEQTANNSSPQKRLIEHTKTQYLANDLITPLVFGLMDTLGFSHQTYQLAFTPALLNDIYGSKVNDLVLQSSGYVHVTDNNWWISSGRNIFLNSGETGTDARLRFYQPVAVKDALGNETRFTYDTYKLMITETEDALKNKTFSEVIDYRLLIPVVVKDLNDNISEILTDELGMVIVTSIRGMETDGMKGDDSLSSYITQPVSNVADVITDPHKYLQQATAFFYYDLFAFKNFEQPPCVAGIVRETHISDLPGNQKSNVQLSVGYSSGLGQNLQTKIQAEPGKAYKWENGKKIEVDTMPDLRWIGSGRVIMNNKGKPVKQYEPFFSTTYQYESEKALVEVGFSSVIFYDGLGRGIRIEHAGGTFSETQFNSWKEQSFDENDTVLRSTWYAALGSPNPAGPEPTSPEHRAGWLAAKHAETFTESHLDSLGRSIYTIVDNGPDGEYETRIILDIESNQMRIIDGRQNVIIKYQYNMLGKQLHQNSMDAGEGWGFEDVLGNIIEVWNNKKQKLRTEYDALHRSTKHFLVEDYMINTPEKLTAFSVYGENQPNDKLRNLRGKLFQSFDQSGRIETTACDFKGNSKSVTQRLAKEYKLLTNWDVGNPASLLENELFVSSSKMDALNRPVEIVLPDGSKSTPAYNEAGLLEKLRIFLNRQNETVEFVKNIDYNAKGLRERIVYGNNTATRYTYDVKSYRLSQLVTTRNNGSDILQHLNYTYDPVGNITEIRDDAQQTVFFNNAAVDPDSKYYYDALYRLKKVGGREHAGQNRSCDQFDKDKTHFLNGSLLTLKGDMNAMQRYEQSYEYDEVGNLLNMIHNAGNGAFVHRWTRSFNYKSTNNQLESTAVSGSTTTYQYDLHGNMLNLQDGAFNLSWNFADQLKEMDLGGGGKVYYTYGGDGQRVRKVIENQNIKKERIYLGGYEIYRERVNNSVTLERETLHVMDDKQRIALVESRTQGNDAGLKDLIRYQYGNHLGTACLEVNGNPLNPQIISYEEFYPYGSSAYKAVRNQTETPKRYQYTGKERDEESGLYYHGARYYAPWLARWTAPDPSGTDGGLNVYAYVDARPVIASDPTGRIFWFFVAAVVIVATLTAVSEAGAPANEEQAKQVKPHISEGEFAAHTAVTGISMAAGGGASKALGGANLVVKGAAEGMVSGGLQAVGDQGIEDVKKGEVSSAQTYANKAAENAETGMLVGGGLGVLGTGVKAAAKLKGAGGKAPGINKVVPKDAPAPKTTTPKPSAPEPPAALQPAAVPDSAAAPPAAVEPPAPAAEAPKPTTAPKQPKPVPQGQRVKTLKNQFNDRVRVGENGRPETFTGEMRPNQSGGTEPSTTARQRVQGTTEGLSSEYHAGHMRANELGGKGGLANTFPQLGKINTGAFRVFEQRLAQLARSAGPNDKIFYSLKFHYSSPTSTVPEYIVARVRINGVTMRAYFSNTDYMIEEIGKMTFTKP